MEINVPYKKREPATVDFSEMRKYVATHNTAPNYIEPGSINIPAYIGADVNAVKALYANIATMTDAALAELVGNTFERILLYGRHGAPKEEVTLLWNLFNNMRFLNALYNVLNTVTLTPEQKTSCNNIIYNYITTSNNTKNRSVKQNIDLIATVVNKDVVDKLSGFRFPNSVVTAAYIGVCANSSMTPIIGVKRLNLFMVNSEDNKTFDEATIVGIYTELYHTCLTVLVEGIMFDCWSKEEIAGLSDNAQDIFYTINLAICDILEQAPYSVIMQVLRAYCIDFYNFGNNNCRFKFILSEDYPRIKSAIDQLSLEGIFVP